MDDMRFTVTATVEADRIAVRVIEWEAGQVYPDLVPLVMHPLVAGPREDVNAAALLAIQTTVRALLARRLYPA